MNSAQAPAATVERLGITQDQLILEVGFDQSDCDQIIRDAITEKTGNKFLDATSQEVVDAVILWDMAVFDMAKKLGLRIHISTQASVSNFASLALFSRLGARRVVLARVAFQYSFRLPVLLPMEWAYSHMMIGRLSGFCASSIMRDTGGYIGPRMSVTGASSAG